MQTNEEFFKSCPKEKLLEVLDENHEQILKHKGELFTIMYYDLDYSCPSEETSGDQYEIGDKVYLSRVGHPKKFVGTAIDHNALSREQLLMIMS